MVITVSFITQLLSHTNARHAKPHPLMNINEMVMLEKYDPLPRNVIMQI